MNFYIQAIIVFVCFGLGTSNLRVLPSRRFNPQCALPCVLGERDPDTCECVLSAKPPSRCDFLGTQCKNGEVCMEVGLAVVCLPDPDAAPSDACSLPMLKGPCFAYFPRYYFDWRMGSCQMFIYSGCHGNANNFATLAQCQQKCESKNTASPFPF